MNYARNDCQQFSFITPFFSDTKNKSWRRCRLYFRGRMQCWWIFYFETDYSNFMFVLPQITYANMALIFSLIFMDTTYNKNEILQIYCKAIGIHKVFAKAK
jgi:hypothetical protein